MVPNVLESAVGSGNRRQVGLEIGSGGVGDGGGGLGGGGEGCEVEGSGGGGGRPPAGPGGGVVEAGFDDVGVVEDGS